MTPSPSSGRTWTTRLQRWTSDRRIPLAVGGFTLLALVARLYDLGERVFYYDEAWFGYWILKFVDHGYWEYRATLHGPFFARVNPPVFSALGADDFTARLVVAVLGGLLPLVAWLFRERLRDVEVVALAGIFALNPILLYYSRFMRKDLPLAVFMLFALGFIVRAFDTRRPRYAYAAAAALGLAATTKESVLLWLLTWLGAGALLLDRRFLRVRDRSDAAAGSSLSDGGETRAGQVRAYATSLAGRTSAGVRAWGPHLAGAALLGLVIVVFFYAPRAGNRDTIGLWRALGGEFGTLPAVIEAATVGTVEKIHAHWLGGAGKQDHAYLPYLSDTLKTMAAGALGVSLLAVVGFLHDRYVGAAPRDLVALNFYAGVAAVLGYPLANHFPVPWSTVHAVAPLAIPAAVGAGVVYRWGRGRLGGVDRVALRSGEVPWHAIRTGLAAALLVFLLANAVGTAVQTSYVAPHDSPRAANGGNEIVYYAQPPAELREVADAIQRAAATGGDDTDVLYVGSRLAGDEAAFEYPPEPGPWWARNPLPWYTEAADADVASVQAPGDIGSDPPPVVVTTGGYRGLVASALGDGYAGTRYRLDGAGDRNVVVFVRE